MGGDIVHAHPRFLRLHNRPFPKADKHEIARNSAILPNLSIGLRCENARIENDSRFTGPVVQTRTWCEIIRTVLGEWKVAGAMR